MKKEIIKPFDLEKAKAGAKLRTRGGLPVEIFKWDARGEFPIKGMIKEEKQDLTACWDLEGSWRNNGISHKFDLVIVEEVEEPKFKVGDWVVRDGRTLLISCIEKVIDGSFYYWFATGTWVSSTKMEEAHLWTIQDAKAGDVLVASDGSIFIFASVDGSACKHYVAITTDGVININEGLEHYWETSEAAHPAGKGQRELLFLKIKEEGYEWDADALKLNKIKPKFWSDDKSNTFGGFFIGTYGDIIEVSKLSNTVSNYNIFATEKQAKSALAMARISQIMANDIENFGGVVTDEEWKSLEWKYVIDRYDDRINTVEVRSVYHFLAFHTKKQRDLFLEKYPQLVRDYLMIDE